MHEYLPFLLSTTLVAQAPKMDEATRQAIQATAMDYIEGWYEGDASRMERAIHPDLAKRIVMPQPDGLPRVEHMGAQHLVQMARSAYGKHTPKENQEKVVQILDVFGKAASVKITAADWVDYLHLGFVNGHWVIVNVLWELKPRG